MAVLLTVAAMAFLATAIFGRDAAVDQAARDETQTTRTPVNR